jgi:hypothetical protein
MQLVQSRQQLAATFVPKAEAIRAYDLALENTAQLESIITQFKDFVNKVWPNLSGEVRNLKYYLQDKRDEVNKYSDTFTLWGKYQADAESQNKVVVRWTESLRDMVENAKEKPKDNADANLPAFPPVNFDDSDPNAIPWVPIAVGGALLLGTLIYLAVRKR